MQNYVLFRDTPNFYLKISSKDLLFPKIMVKNPEIFNLFDIPRYFDNTHNNAARRGIPNRAAYNFSVR